MSKTFKRNELERLKCVTEDDIDLVLKYQRKLPVLCDDSAVDEFSVDARLLHRQLGVSKEFSKWIKSNLKDYVENTDYITVVPRDNGENQGKFIISKEYFLTLDLAKEISMFTGKNSQASKELKEASRMTRKYFILMEHLVLENKEWLTIRDPEKVEYKNMCSEIDAWNFRI